MLAAPHFTT